MSDDLIHLTLSRADAEWLHGHLLDESLELWERTKAPGRICATINTALDAALAAPAEGPERAATGETLVRCGRCGVPFPPHPDPARFDHDFCEECLPEAVKHWGMMQTLPERRAAEETDAYAAACAHALESMVSVHPDLYAKMLRVAYHAMLAQEVPESRMIELQLIMTEAAGWPEDDRVVIDVLMQQWEEENEALRAAGEERGA